MCFKYSVAIQHSYGSDSRSGPCNQRGPRNGWLQGQFNPERRNQETPRNNKAGYTPLSKCRTQIDISSASRFRQLKSQLLIFTFDISAWSLANTYFCVHYSSIFHCSSPFETGHEFSRNNLMMLHHLCSLSILPA